MEVFITAAQGAGKTTLARKMATEFSILGKKPSKPTRITEVSVYGKSLERDVQGSDIIIFEDIYKQDQLNAARAYYAKQERKPLCFYVTTSDLNVTINPAAPFTAEYTQ